MSQTGVPIGQVLLLPASPTQSYLTLIALGVSRPTTLWQTPNLWLVELHAYLSCPSLNPAGTLSSSCQGIVTVVNSA